MMVWETAEVESDHLDYGPRERKRIKIMPLELQLENCKL